MSRPRVAALAVVVAGAAALFAGCTIPITSQTITGGALNAGAMFMIDQFNDEGYPGEGRYDYEIRADVDTLVAIFEAAVTDANLRHSRPPVPGPRAEGDFEGGPATDRPRNVRPGDPPAPETFPRRQWTPAPLFSFPSDAPDARGDTLSWIVTHRADRQAGFLLVPRAGGSLTHVAIVPYDPPGDVFLSVPADHAQRNAVEELHQVLYLAILERLGPTAFEQPFRLEAPPTRVASP